MIETNRANLAQEQQKRDELAETQKYHTASVNETIRSNIAKETETARANQAKEQETNRANLAKEGETARHNRVSEGIEGVKAAGTLLKGIGSFV